MTEESVDVVGCAAELCGVCVLTSSVRVSPSFQCHASAR